MSVRLSLAFALVVASLSGARADDSLPAIFPTNAVVLFQGDSITHGGRANDMNHYLGHGYQAEIAMRYLARCPQLGLQFANRGISGNSSANLLSRWSYDAVPFTPNETGYANAFPQYSGGTLMPDVLSILVGINDYMHKSPSARAYEENVRSLVSKSLAASPGMRIVLCEPFRIPEDRSPDFLARQAAVRRIADEYNLAFVPFQRMFSAAFAEWPVAGYWSWDACHPTYPAHLRMADFWIETVAREFAAGKGRPKPAAPSETAVVWRTPSVDEKGSMVLGNGELGVNLWITADGTIHTYLQNSDSWNEAGRHQKLAGMDFQTGVRADASFLQALDVDRGLVRARWPGVRVEAWVDACSQTLIVKVKTKNTDMVRAKLNNWRVWKGGMRTYTDEESEDADPGARVPKKFARASDVVFSGLPNGRIASCHDNGTADELYGFQRKWQGLENVREFENVHAGKTYGVMCDRSSVDGTVVFTVAGLTVRGAAKEWAAQANAEIDRAIAEPYGARRDRHVAWWRDWAARSYIRVSADGADAAAAAAVDEAYRLQRYMEACAGRGRWPIRFNGSIFTVDPGDKTPDYRRWGSGYWWQNTRLPYWPLLASGDHEMMMPLFDLYMARQHPFHKVRTHEYFGHDGAYFAECVYPGGDCFTANYTVPRGRKTDPLQDNPYHKREWTGMMELSLMALDYWDYTRDDAFLRQKALPAITDYLKFFDNRYRLDAEGRYHMYPGQALEMWWDCTNAIPEVAGMAAVTRRLLALPSALSTDEQRALWRRCAARVPALPTESAGPEGIRYAPGKNYKNVKCNCENVELYTVFPYRLATFATTNYPLALATWRTRHVRGARGWQQDNVDAALLRDVASAKAYMVERCTGNTAAGYRLRTMWGPNFDWIPDQCAGGNILLSLQYMVMYAEDRKIYLNCAWPKEWSCAFRLHAPERTVVSGRIEKGVVRDLVVIPAARAADVVVLRELPEVKSTLKQGEQ